MVGAVLRKLCGESEKRRDQRDRCDQRKRHGVLQFHGKKKTDIIKGSLRDTKGPKVTPDIRTMGV